MGKVLILEPQISIAGNDFSGFVRSVTVNLEREGVDVTTSGAGARQTKPGLKTESFEVTFAQDFDASGLDETLWPLYRDGTAFEIAVSADPPPITSSNPQYVGDCQLLSYQPLSGEIGALSETTVTFPASEDSQGFDRLTT